MKVHLCIDCKKETAELVAAGDLGRIWKPRPRWSGLKDGDPFRCATHGRAWRDRNRRRDAESRIRRMGIEPELYWELYEFQGGTCAIPRCRATGKVKLLAVEHDHKIAESCEHDTKTQVCRRCIRGLMCGPHNYELLGKYQNSLQDALDYLARPPAQVFLAEQEERFYFGAPLVIPAAMLGPHTG